MGRARALAVTLGRVLGLAAAFGCLAFGIGDYGLTERSEARYGSIATEMVRSGDYLIPRFNGQEHFEKPPLSMWAMAGSERLLGESELALRLPGVLAGVWGVLAAFLLAGGRSSRRAPLAAALTLVCPLYFVMARTVTTDIYLAAFSTLTLLLAARATQTDDERRRSRLLTLAVAASALGFLTKGPVIWVLTLVPVAIEMAWSRRGRELRMLVAPGRIALFVAIVAPWFLLLGLRRPELMSWFLRERTVAVLLSSRGFHSGPAYYYIPVLLVGLLPAGPILVAAGRRGLGGEGAASAAERQQRLLLVAILFPLLVFSLSASKLATYLLPLVVPAAVLSAAILDGSAGRRSLMAGAGLLAALALAAGAVTWQRGWLEGLRPAGVERLASAGVLAVVGASSALALAARHRVRLAAPVLVGAQTAALLLCVAAAPLVERDLGVGSARPFALAVKEVAGDGRPLAFYGRGLVRSLPFYTGRDVQLIGVGDVERLRQHLHRGAAVVLCHSRNLEALREAAGELRVIEQDGALFILTRGPDPPPRSSGTGS